MSGGGSPPSALTSSPSFLCALNLSGLTAIAASDWHWYRRVRTFLKYELRVLEWQTQDPRLKVMLRVGEAITMFDVEHRAWTGTITATNLDGTYSVSIHDGIGSTEDQSEQHRGPIVAHELGVPRECILHQSDTCRLSTVFLASRCQRLRCISLEQCSISSLLDLSQCTVDLLALRLQHVTRTSNEINMQDLVEWVQSAWGNIQVLLLCEDTASQDDAVGYLAEQRGFGAFARSIAMHCQSLCSLTLQATMGIDSAASLEMQEASAFLLTSVLQLRSLQSLHLDLPFPDDLQIPTPTASISAPLVRLSLTLNGMGTEDIIDYFRSLLPFVPMLLEVNIELVDDVDLTEFFEVLVRECPELRSLTLNACDGISEILQRLSLQAYSQSDDLLLLAYLPKLVELNLSPQSATDDAELQQLARSLAHIRPHLNLRLDRANHNDLGFDNDRVADAALKRMWLALVAD